MEKNLANILTGCRILCSIFMIFIPLFSAYFYIVYLLCGFSDMIDGTVARKTNSNNEFGARLDTVADCVFLAVSVAKFLPVIEIPGWLWVWIAMIAGIKLRNIVWGWINRKKLISMHTMMNKMTGFLLFLFPLVLHFVELKYSAIVVCAVATYAAIQEWYYIGMGHEIM